MAVTLAPALGAGELDLDEKGTHKYVSLSCDAIANSSTKSTHTHTHTHTLTHLASE